ncbi:uncharacterized protein C1orf112 homolog isoform X1 [Lampris incognitus]|uniref:uncharacterized protein C1orf112 homolog isoform X1 n=1 Tax=Lampris incognitus TaxID=2546036 RepID=UPI0024B5B250|nr:uncharacterized protein C1orf112 homolog isoform X1 [Lampris incognitus]
MFLPHIGLSELEEECFSKILPEAVSMFNSLTKEILNQVGGLSSQNTELRTLLRNILQAMVQIIEVMSACVRHVSSFEKAPEFRAIRSLPSCIIKILKDTFQHCKESQEIYCGCLSLLADLLQDLFKEACSLQKGVMELLDRISLDTSTSEEEVSDIVMVIHSLLDVCVVIASLDMAMHANTWKFIIKQSVRYQSLVEEHLRHGDITNSLADNLLAYFSRCLELGEQITQAGQQENAQSPDYKLLQKTMKMCRFFANTLVHYIKEFKSFLAKYCSRFHQLYLQIVSMFGPCLGAPALPSPLSEELNVVALVPMEALLSQLLPLRPFAEVVLRREQQLSPKYELPQCLLLVNVLGQLATQPEEVLQLWYAGSQFSEEIPRLPLYQAVLDSFRRCYTERKVPVLLPGVMMNGHAQVRVTLHHHVCVQLCAGVAMLPPLYFPVLECCLLEAVLQPDTQTALLATDVWCFTARYGTAELCLHNVLVIAHLVKKCRRDCYQLSNLGLLLKRMLFLMMPNHQVELVERFPPSEMENMPVWHHVLLRALSPDACARVATDVISLTQKALADWQSGGYKLGHVDKVNEVLLCLLAVVKEDPSPGGQHTLSAVRILTQVWLRMCPSQVQTQPVLQATLRLLLLISAAVVRNLEAQVICQALACVSALVSQKCPDEVVLAALDFLASLGKVFVPHDSQNQVLPRLSSLFGALLAERSWLLHQHAMEAFANFAEITNHEEVISQSLSVEETKTKLVNYLSKTVCAREAAETRLERLRCETSVIEQHNKRLETNKENIMNESPAKAVTDSEPCPKTAPHETSEVEYSHHVQTAEAALKALLGLAEADSDMAAPQWLESKLQELQTLITQISAAQWAT